jgi:hypothetical protein
MTAEGYYAMPWVKPFFEWLKGEPEYFLRLATIVLGVITVLIAMFAPAPLVLLWLVFMISP